MQVYIMRHGEAALEAASDSARPLTHCGCNESRQMALWLEKQDPGIDLVLVSPFLRAEQTLSEVQDCLALPKKVEVLATLTPDGDAAKVARHLEALAHEGLGAVLVISHLPLVGYLVSELCPDEAPPMFATSGIACVSYDPRNATGTLQWQVSPSRLDKAI